MPACSVMNSLKAGPVSCSSVGSQYLSEHLALCTRSVDVMMNEHIVREQSSKGWYHDRYFLFPGRQVEGKTQDVG